MIFKQFRHEPLSAASYLLGCPRAGEHETAPELVRYPVAPLTDGQVLRAGAVELTALHTPGHTPEHTSFVVRDTLRSAEPWFVLTGDSLFVGDVGRPDLLVGDAALDVMDEAERARTQYRSIHERLFTLPGHRRGLPPATTAARPAAA